MRLKKGFRQLLEGAEAKIEAIEARDAIPLLEHEDVIFVDLREIQELRRYGMIPGAFHAPRGLLEFWVDPESPYHKPIFATGKRFVLYCAIGWRSALAARALVEMGVPKVMHLAGGLSAWKTAGGKVAGGGRSPDGVKRRPREEVSSEAPASGRSRP